MYLLVSQACFFLHFSLPTALAGSLRTQWGWQEMPISRFELSQHLPQMPGHWDWNLWTRFQLSRKAWRSMQIMLGAHPVLSTVSMGMGSFLQLGYNEPSYINEMDSSQGNRMSLTQSLEECLK